MEVCDLFIGCFEEAGCRMISMSCEEHDEHAAVTTKTHAATPPPLQFLLPLLPTNC
jgi:hypothetical protein